MPEPEKEMSFEESRKEMVRQMISSANKPIIEKVIPFHNNDVPEFLKRLAAFEEKSRKVSLLIK